jgi:hypothetical protein
LRFAVTFSISIGSVLLNELISKIFLILGRYLKRHLTINEQKITFKIIFVMEFCNMGLLVIINGFDRLGIQKALMGDSYAIQSRIYEDFTV